MSPFTPRVGNTTSEMQLGGARGMSVYGKGLLAQMSVQSSSESLDCGSPETRTSEPPEVYKARTEARDAALMNLTRGGL